MNIKKLSFVTAAVITLAATTVVSVTPASAWWCRWGRCGYGWGGYGYGWGPGAVAAGVLAAAAVGAAVGASRADTMTSGPPRSRRLAAIFASGPIHAANLAWDLREAIRA
jgi:hypothetical protein